MKIRGHEVSIDVEYELRQFEHLFRKAKWSEERLICCSPFRTDDNRPSFWVRLRAGDGHSAGIFSDSGAVDNFYDKGNFIKLYAFLHDVDLDTAEEMLLEQYHTERTDLTWRPLHLSLKGKRKELKENLLVKYTEENKYLETRNIKKDIINLFSIGYSSEEDSIAIPWRYVDGTLANVKYRRTKTKHFHYEKDGVPIRDLIWGLDKIYEKGFDKAIICEGEVDAMTSWSYGIPAIAIGGAAFNRKRAEMLIKSPLKTIIIATDNDDTGRKVRRDIANLLKRDMTVEHFYVPNPYKDLNDLPQTVFNEFLSKRKRETINFLKNIK